MSTPGAIVAVVLPHWAVVAAGAGLAVVAALLLVVRLVRAARARRR